MTRMNRIQPGKKEKKNVPVNQGKNVFKIRPARRKKELDLDRSAINLVPLEKHF